MSSSSKKPLVTTSSAPKKHSPIVSVVSKYLPPVQTKKDAVPATKKIMSASNSNAKCMTIASNSTNVHARAALAATNAMSSAQQPAKVKTNMTSMRRLRQIDDDNNNNRNNNNNNNNDSDSDDDETEGATTKPPNSANSSSVMIPRKQGRPRNPPPKSLTANGDVATALIMANAATHERNDNKQASDKVAKEQQDVLKRLAHVKKLNKLQPNSWAHLSVSEVEPRERHCPNYKSAVENGLTSLVKCLKCTKLLLSTEFRQLQKHVCRSADADYNGNSNNDINKVVDWKELTADCVIYVGLTSTQIAMASKLFQYHGSLANPTCTQNETRFCREVVESRKEDYLRFLTELVAEEKWLTVSFDAGTCQPVKRHLVVVNLHFKGKCYLLEPQVIEGGGTVSAVTMRKCLTDALKSIGRTIEHVRFWVCDACKVNAKALKDLETNEKELDITYDPGLEEQITTVMKSKQTRSDSEFVYVIEVSCIGHWAHNVLLHALHDMQELGFFKELFQALKLINSMFFGYAAVRKGRYEALIEKIKNCQDGPDALGGILNQIITQFQDVIEGDQESKWVQHFVEMLDAYKLTIPINQAMTAEALFDFANAHLKKLEESKVHSKRMFNTAITLSQTRWVNATYRAVEHILENFEPLVMFLDQERASTTKANNSENLLAEKFSEGLVAPKIVEQAKLYLEIFQEFVDTILKKYSDPSTKPQAHLVSADLRQVEKRYRTLLQTCTRQLDQLEDSATVECNTLTQKKIGYATIVHWISKYQSDTKTRPIWLLASLLSPAHAAVFVSVGTLQLQLVQCCSQILDRSEVSAIPDNEWSTYVEEVKKLSTKSSAIHSAALRADPVAEFWAKKEVQCKMPQLTKVAMTVLYVPPIVNSVDSFFSVMERDITDRRSKSSFAMWQSVLRSVGDYRNQKGGFFHEYFLDTRSDLMRYDLGAGTSTQTDVPPSSMSPAPRTPANQSPAKLVHQHAASAAAAAATTI